jgi:metal-responsive CopG/Arc/MetJ family transcriptional regulator
MAIKTEKVTVSLPKHDLRMVAEYEGKLHVPRSALFKQAIELWLAVKEKEEIKEKYITVYSNPKIREKQLERVKEMLPIALEIWPKY